MAVWGFAAPSPPDEMLLSWHAAQVRSRHLRKQPPGDVSKATESTNRVRRSHFEANRLRNRRDQDPRSCQVSTPVLIQDPPLVPPQPPSLRESRTSATPTPWSPATSGADIPRGMPFPLGETLCSGLSVRKGSGRSITKTVPGPQPPPLPPELTSLGDTANRVRGTVEWQRSRARLRKWSNFKPKQVFEIKMPIAGTVGDFSWRPAVLEKDLAEGGRRFALVDDAQAKPVVVPRDEIRGNVRPLGATQVRARTFCFLCGRELGLPGLPFHIQKCLLKWDSRVALPSRHLLELVDPRALPTGPGKDLER